MNCCSICRGTAVMLSVALGLVACGCAVLDPHYPNSHPSDKYLDARAPSKLDTAGTESADLLTACNQAVGKMLASPVFGSGLPTVVTVDPEYVVVQSSDGLDPQAVADALRNELINASQGRVTVIHHPFPNAEADKEAHGGAVPPSSPIPANYAVGASVTEVEQTSHGVTERYTQINVQAIHIQSRQVVFSDMYAFKKAASGNNSDWI